ncbi:MAG: hypothetical protein ACUVRG_10190, partial [Ignavibacterium sp.]|uniref:hypothetical protein n=1 Tax=Ignavibacterium sp. TaxID=2651167 RepID=UPI004048FF00
VYINQNGITLYLNSDIEVRGIQAEFSNFGNYLGDMRINTSLGQGYFFFGENILRVLLYDRMGIKIVRSGNNFVAYL